MAKRIIPDSDSYAQVTTELRHPNALLTKPGGDTVCVDITPEAKAVWERFGFKVEWLPVIGKQVAA